MKSLQKLTFFDLKAEKPAKVGVQMSTQGPFLSIFKPLLMIPLIFLTSFTVGAQERCSDIYPFQQQLYSADYIPYLQARLGGNAHRWHEIFLRYHEGNKSLSELLLIDQIFARTEVRSWLARKANSFQFVRLDSITRTLDRLYMEQIDLSRIKKWEHLSLYERRALLLIVFKKWWWEVDSHYVIGFSRWTDVNYLMSRSLVEPVVQGRLDARLHELLATPSQNSFFSSLLGRFRTEIKTLEALRNQPEAREVLVETLTHRIEFLKRSRDMYQIQGQRLNLMNIHILRAAVLRAVLQKGRALKTEEIQAVTVEQGLNPALVKEIYWGQLGMSLIPNMNTLVNVAIDIAITTGLAVVISHYWFDELADQDLYQGEFNDFFATTPMSEN